MKRYLLVVTLIFALIVTTSAQEDAETVDRVNTLPAAADYTWETVVEGLDNPIYVANAGDGSGRLFAVEQPGFVLVIEDGEINNTPFLDVTELVPSIVIQARYTEQGLLGLAFHPDFADNGQFFVNYSDSDGNTVIERYTVMADDPNRADMSSAEQIMFYEQPLDNHNGGQLAFGADGMLYIGTGDGGGAGDPLLNGQNPATIHGAILRVDVSESPFAIPDDNPFVDEDGFLPEIWMFGLRNPWRFSFDRLTGDLYIADVGQEMWEEVNYVSVDEAGGQNFGWNTFEGFETYNVETETVGETTDPIAVYDHSQGCSVTGGYVYRGDALPELNGVYFYGDYCNGNVFAAYIDDDGEWQSELFMETEFVISSFGEDDDGELLLVDYKGVIYRLTGVEDEV